MIGVAYRETGSSKGVGSPSNLLVGSVVGKQEAVT